MPDIPSGPIPDIPSAPAAWSWSEPGGLSPRRIGLLSLDVTDRPMNVLTLEGLAELETRLVEAPRLGFDGIIVASAKRDFLAGADVELIAAVRTEAEGREKAERGQS